MNFLNSLPKSTRPLPYTRLTPIEERRKFINHLYQNGYTISEIKKVYPTMTKKCITKHCKKK